MVESLASLSMKRPTDSGAQRSEDERTGTSPFKRFRSVLGGSTASTFKRTSSTSKLARSSFTFCISEDARVPFAFHPSSNRASQAPREYTDMGGKSTMGSSVLAGIGQERLSRAFERPFGGVALQSAHRGSKAQLQLPSTDSKPTMPLRV